jgi:peptidoglycan/LPS O-acetylase OafA/YrhL
MYAVGGFFVMSGYTMGAISLRSNHFDVAGFVSERSSRLPSVSEPAIV